MIGAALRFGDFFEYVTIAIQFLERRLGNVFHRFDGSFEIAGQAARGFFYQVARGAARLSRVLPSSFRKYARATGYGRMACRLRRSLEFVIRF
jgi:hypothetical protein